MSVLEVANLEFGFTNEPLFSGVTFRLEAGERAALVAPNGAGKSTLLRVIAGELAPDQGSVQLKRGASLAYYRQSHENKLSGTVMDALMSGFEGLVDVRRELAVAQARAASGSARASSPRARSSRDPATRPRTWSSSRAREGRAPQCAPRRERASTS